MIVKLSTILVPAVAPGVTPTTGSVKPIAGVAMKPPKTRIS